MTHILAALIFFTRLPFWKIAEVPADYFKHIVPYWPFAGLVTGGIMVVTLWICAQVMPVGLAWLFAIVARLLTTSCLHEDGLADFCDGMGGGTSRQRILEIMKDSHIGTYGTVGLIVYFIALWQVGTMPLNLLCAVAFSGDCWCKFCSSNIINILPYARKEEEAKNKTVYSRMTSKEFIIDIIVGAVPFVIFLPSAYWIALLSPIMVFSVMIMIMKRKINGYTGDCCGAMFTLCELSFLMTCLCLYTNTLTN